MIRSTGLFVFGTLIAATISLSSVQAATFGHSRIVSTLGQPLHLEIPVTQLTQQEIDSLRAVPAPAEAWREAGMTPPVALESMRLVLLDGYRSDVKVIQLRSDQVFDQPIVDVLLDVRSVSGQQRYQVSLLAHADRQAVVRAGTDTARQPRAIDGRGPLATPGEHAAAGRQIAVRAGDNMFAIARRNAVQGVTVYQMMIALQRANPQAFIEDNVNLVRAGATLTMPGMDALTALSDREARRIFQQHAQAFARYGQRGGVAEVAALATLEHAAQGSIAPQVSLPEADPAAAPATGDRLRLSGAPGNGVAGAASINDGAAVNATGSAARSAAPSSQPHDAATSATGSQGLAGNRTSPGMQAGAGGAATVADPVASLSAGDPSVSLLAASGAIASDAVADRAPVAVSADTAGSGTGSFGSDATTAGTVLEAGNGTDPDDQAALNKGVQESRTRVLELEDNVRHLNEALQKQGHVAAEAALEGARSVTEVIKEVIGIVDAEKTEGQAAAPSEAAIGPDGQSATAGGTGTDAAPAAGNAQGAANGAVAPSTPEGSAQAPATQGQGGTAAAQRGETANGAAAVGGAASTGSTGGPAAQSKAGTQPASPAPSSQSTPSSRTGAEVSWFQENMLAVIGGGLALIVLLVAWLLRRASAAKRDMFESDSPITDSMVRDRLREIDLDLDTPPSGEPGPRAS